MLDFTFCSSLELAVSLIISSSLSALRFARMASSSMSIFSFSALIIQAVDNPSFFSPCSGFISSFSFVSSFLIINKIRYSEMAWHF